MTKNNRKYCSVLFIKYVKNINKNDKYYSNKVLCINSDGKK